MEPTLGDYRLIGFIGAGARGEVFRAEHTITRRVEALKLLRQRIPGEEEERALLREIEIQASLQHTNIAAVHNAFRALEGLALVMELVDGEPLSARLERGRIPLREGARYVAAVLDALEYAHGRGVVHRDVKPANIMLAAAGAVKLTDFGLAQTAGGGPATGAGLMAGSPYYMSPEQVVGAPSDGRSDCYSVGVILYEIAAGRRPFEGDGAFDVMLQHREAVPQAPMTLEPRIGPELNAVILRALEKDPARRFQSARELRAALEKALAKCPAAGKPRSWSRIRMRWLAAASLAGAVGMSAALMPGLRQRAAAVAPETPPAAAVPGAAAPAAEPAPAETVEEPKTEAPSAGSDRKPVRPKPVAPDRPRNQAAAAPREFLLPPPKAKAQPEIAAAPILPAPPEVATAPAGAPVQLPAPEPAAAALPAQPEPAKRPNALRRALGWIAHPRGKKPEEREKE